MTNTVENHRSLTSKRKIIAKQKEILLTLIQGTEGKAWAEDRVGWSRNSIYEVCYWDGIDCDPEVAEGQIVTGIFLPGIGLSGTIPMELSELTSLREITLPKNNLHGTIPKALANSLTKLKIINLSSNKLTGQIPVFQSKKITEIALSNNEFTGTIPLQIGEKITDYDVCVNQLTGTIPSSISKMTSLQAFSISQNGLSGTIPSFLGKLEKIHFLFMDNNHFMGTIPPSLTRVSSELEEIWLHDNLLSGTIPAAVADVASLFNFYMDGNKLTGTVPAEVCKKKLNMDFFVNVKIQDVDRDYCEAVACPTGTVSKEGVYPCIRCRDMYSNPYLGRQGSCIDLKPLDILKIFYDATGGDLWEYPTAGERWFHVKDDNKKKNIQTFEEREICAWVGIECDNENNIISIRLQKYGLRGTIPDEIGFLRFLTVLDLSDNYLDGFLPSDLRWAPLEQLDVSGNRLKGIVPPSLCEKEGINENGHHGHFDCSFIACPMGTVSPTGSLGGVGSVQECEPCKYGTSYLGGKKCIEGKFGGSDIVSSSNARLSFRNNAHAHDENGSKFVMDALLIIFGIAIVGFLFSYREIRKLYREKKTIIMNRPNHYEYSQELNCSQDDEDDEEEQVKEERENEVSLSESNGLF